jgi:protein SCO1/2
MKPTWTRVSPSLPSRRRSRSEIGARLALLLLAGALIAADDPGLRAGVFEPPRAAPEISLRGSDGATLELGRFRGKIVILQFGFTSCPKVCPTTLASLAEARRKLGEQANDLQVVYVTVDPERDDVERLRKYLAGFDTTFVGGTGTEEQLEAVRKDYGIVAAKVTADADYTFSHSSYTYLIDREGQLRALMPYGQPSDDYVHDVKVLLAK